MANKEHLAILKRGIKRWNKWRLANPDIVANLSGAKLSGRNLSGADLRWANLRDAKLERTSLRRVSLNDAKLDRANLNWADLSSADLSEANLTFAKLTHANLTRAYLSRADFSDANLSHANLRQANLIGAKLSRTRLSGADLRWAGLLFADLSGAGLGEANFTNAQIGWCTFGNVNLRSVKGIETLRCFGPSTIGIDTIYHSEGNIPEVFLRDAGVQDDFIAYMYSLVGAAFEFYFCFISYSSKNQEFAARLHADLQSQGVRCWFAPKDLRIGDRLRLSFDEAIRRYDKLLVVLSQSSVKSQWVEKEVETAFERERQQNRTVLFPIRLDDAVMETNQAWAADIRRTRHIGNFRDWKDHDFYKKAFDQLLKDLKAKGKAKSAVQK